jgi:hypothetical protein
MKSTVLTILFALAALTGEAQENVNNFKVSVKVTQGIDDAGYLVHVYDRNQIQRKFIDKITVSDKRTAFETRIDEPLVGDLTAIFPDGTVCSACVRFPFVPGEQVQVKVKNGTFELSGSKFYQEWSDADDLEENAHKYYKKSETDSIILNYLKRHADEEGCVMRYWQYEILPRQTILSIIPEAVRNGRFKYFFDKYQPQAQEWVVADELTVAPEPSRTITFEPSAPQKIELQRKAALIKTDMDVIKATYASLKPFVESKMFNGTDVIFEQITKQNQVLDKNCQNFIKALKDLHAPQQEEAQMLSEIYKEFAKFYADQNKGFAELYMEAGTQTKAVQKAQKAVNKLAGKYITEMSKITRGE